MKPKNIWMRCKMGLSDQSLGEKKEIWRMKQLWVSG